MNHPKLSNLRRLAVALVPGIFAATAFVACDNSDCDCEDSILYYEYVGDVTFDGYSTGKIRFSAQEVSTRRCAEECGTEIQTFAPGLVSHTDSIDAPGEFTFAFPVQFAREFSPSIKLSAYNDANGNNTCDSGEAAGVVNLQPGDQPSIAMVLSAATPCP